MKAFNLERALAGDPVVTRTGIPVQIIYSKLRGDTIHTPWDLDSNQPKNVPQVLFKRPLLGIIEHEVWDEPQAWRTDGRFFIDESEYDLFMVS